MTIIARVYETLIHVLIDACSQPERKSVRFRVTPLYPFSASIGTF
jgi:hypothetical protein